jgi:hypothetical protein
LYDIRMLDALFVDRYWRYVTEYIQPTALHRFVGGPYASPEEPLTRHVGNPMFDMLGARYVIADAPLPDSALMIDVARDSPTDVRVLDIPGDLRASIFLHPPGTIFLPDPPKGATTLTLAIGMDRQAFADPINDGVQFKVTGIDAAGEEVVLFSEAYIPRSDPETPEWRDRKISLMQEGERVGSLSITTDPLGNSSTDWAGFADLEYRGSVGEEFSEALTLTAVTQNSLLYTSPTALPRAWVAGTVHGVDDVDGAIAFFNERRDADDMVEFSPAEEVVIEGVESSAPTCDDPAEVTISEYDSDSIEIATTAKCSGFLVLADAWYPGWRAEVNGEAETIYPANVAFRGVPVPAGTSSVRFTYEPSSFRIGLLVAFIGLGTFAAWAGVVRFRRRRPPTPRPTQVENESGATSEASDEEAPLP